MLRLRRASLGALTSRTAAKLCSRWFASEATAATTISQIVVQKHEGGIATVQMSAGPVNALSSSMCKDLLTTLKELEDDGAVRGLVLGSSVPGMFSAGLHLPELLLPVDNSIDALANYWTLVQELWLAFHTTPLATVAALPGHCIAGGLVPALACDARVMVNGGKFKLGFNETAFGLVPPPWLCQLFIEVLGHKRKAEALLMRGTLVNPETALELGLVDELVPLHQLSDAAQAKLEELLRVPDAARRKLKIQLRQDAAEALREAQSEDLDAFVSFTAQPEVQRTVASYVESLGSGTKAKKDEM